MITKYGTQQMTTTPKYKVYERHIKKYMFYGSPNEEDEMTFNNASSIYWL